MIWAPESFEIVWLRGRQAHALKAVLDINAAMFVIELTASMIARLTAHMIHSIDRLGHALVYPPEPVRDRPGAEVGCLAGDQAQPG